MKWNSPRKKPTCIYRPVLCQVSYTEEDFFTGVEVTKTAYCVCVCTENDKGKREWVPQVNHLVAATMPSADYYVLAKDKFKVQKWLDFISLFP